MQAQLTIRMFWQSLKTVIPSIKGPTLIELGDTVSNQSEICLEPLIFNLIVVIKIIVAAFIWKKR